MRAAQGVGGEGAVPQGHGDPRRGEQRPEGRRPGHRKSLSPPPSLLFPFLSVDPPSLDLFYLTWNCFLMHFALF